MDRLLTAIATSAWVGVLVAIGAASAYWTIAQPGSSEREAARSMVALLASLAAGIVAGGAAFVVVRFHAPASSLRLVQVADGVAIAALLVWAFIGWRGQATSPPPYYEGFEGVLDVEVRAPMKTEVMVFLANGEAESKPHREFTRRDGEYAIVPFELRIRDHHRWAVAVTSSLENGQMRRYFYPLNMPDHPEGALPWSEWIHAVPKKDWNLTDDISVRFRWVLIPSNSIREYQP